MTGSVRTATRSAPAHRRARPAIEADTALWVFLALMLFGLVLRILVYRSGWMGQDSDEATGEVMVMRAAQGHLSLFYWGQNYGGAGLTWIEAVLVKLFGFRLIIFWLVDTLIVAGCCVILRSVARRMLPPVAASVAAGAFFFFPPLWVFWSSREYLFWSPAILFSLLCTNSVLNFLDRREGRDVLLAGLFMGLAIWCYPVTADLVFLPGLALLVALVKGRELGRIVVAAVAAIVGVSPWLAYFVLHGSAAFATKYTDQSKLTALRGALVDVMPTALVGGQRRSGLIWAGSVRSHTDLVVLGTVVFGGSLLCLIWLLATRSWALAANSGVILLWPIVLVAGHVLLVTSAFRYGFIAVPALLIEGAWLVSRVRLAVVMAALLAVFSTYLIGHETQWFAASPSCLPALNSLDAQLEAQGHTRLWAAYWIAADMTVCSGGQVQAAATNVSRDVIARQDAAALTRPLYVVFVGNTLDKQIGSYVSTHPGVAVRQVVDGFAVWSFNSQVEPAQMALNATT